MWSPPDLPISANYHRRDHLIKKLRGFSRSQYRLRVGDDVRVFFDVTAEVVEVLAIVPKSEADAWLEKHGESDETGSSL